MLRVIAAPALREVAEIRFDTDHDPAVTWDAHGCRFDLIDPRRPDDPDARLPLASFDAPVADPERLAQALAEGLAACDFPPTADGAHLGHVRAALSVAGIEEVPTA